MSKDLGRCIGSSHSAFLFYVCGNVKNLNSLFTSFCFGVYSRNSFFQRASSLTTSHSHKSHGGLVGLIEDLVDVAATKIVSHGETSTSLEKGVQPEQASVCLLLAPVKVNGCTMLSSKQ
jgi:hypothetical protein